MSNEIVKYGNALNSVAFRKFNAREMNLFFSIVSRMRNKGSRKVTFTFDELKELSRYKQHGSKFREDLKSTYNKMLSLNMWYDEGNVAGAWVLFTGFKINFEKSEATISVNPELQPVLNKIASWTRFGLEQFANLRSTYAKTMFRLLKQYRIVGRREFSMEEFRALLDVPKSYGSDAIDRRVLKPIKEELSSIFAGLSVRKKRGGRGGKVVGYIFTWKPEPKNKDDFKKSEYWEETNAINNIKNNPELTDNEKFRAIDKVKGLRMGSTKKTHDDLEKAEDLKNLLHKLLNKN
ncbi:replication initiation protein [Fructilactobacillus sanfranciscensis]|uniref:replication initiation protein n=1 Tax=Fructilactobacillus sanfranciscensis TaxID=1625 RepID=UPI0031F89288